jgi:hypothetical protein
VVTISGDGSDGAMTIAAATDWTANPPPGTFQFSAFTVNAGQTLTVPSGLTIRVAGDVTIAGTILVAENPFSNAAAVQSVPPDLGACSTVAPTNSRNLNAGSGGRAVAEAVARQLLHPGFSGGGDGAGLTQLNGEGGGVFRILASGTITIASGGAIVADGVAGEDATFSLPSGGGGAGGIVIVAASTSIINSGRISASGAAGGNGSAADSRASSGGGGGGIIHLLAPSITGGTLQASGGAGGTGGTGLSNAGGGGGACGGNGGDWGASTGVNGSDGHSYVTIIANPATLFGGGV